MLHIGAYVLLEFLNELTQSGLRIFSTQDARAIASKIGVKNSSVNYVIKSLIAKKIIRPLFKGNYAIEDNLLAGSPLHKFEIAMHLAKSCVICCWSAMSYHEITDQVLSTVYLYDPQEKGKSRSLYKYKIDGYEFVLIQTSQKALCGVERKFFGEAKIQITDLEKTLLDGLTHPQYCGGLRESLNAFEIAKNRMDMEKLINYAKTSSLAVQKRLGWVLDYLELTESQSIKVSQTNHFDKLDPAKPRKGKYNKKWMLVENF